MWTFGRSRPNLGQLRAKLGRLRQHVPSKLATIRTNPNTLRARLRIGEIRTKIDRNCPGTGEVHPELLEITDELAEPDPVGEVRS